MNKITQGLFLTKRKTLTVVAFFAMFLTNLQKSMGQTAVPMSSQVGLTYSENFSDIANWTNNFVSGTGSSRWASYPTTTGGTANDGKRTTKSSTTFVTSTSGGVQKGSGNLLFLSTGSSATSEAVAVDLLLNFSGVLAGTLSFNWAAVDNGGGTRPTTLRVYWSIDNSTFTEITTAQIIDIQSPSSGSISAIDLPASFNNAATARLRFYNHAGTVSGSGNRDKISIDDVQVTALAPTSTTWNGSTWSYGAPAASIDAIVAGNYSIAANIIAKTLTVNNSAVVTIPSGNNVTITGAVTVTAPATLTFSNNTNLIQDALTTVNSNTGSITVNRNSSLLKRFDFTLWSSPVAGQNLVNFSPLTSRAPSRFYTFNTLFNDAGASGAYAEILDPATTTFSAGAGYLIRMPNTADAVTPTAFAGQFTGVPNNGDVTVTLVDGASPGLRYNLVGNPYPSTLQMQKFVFDNTANIQNTLWFWRKTNGPGTAFCTWQAGALVTDPGTFVTNGNAQSLDPAGIIQTAQGFFVEAKSGVTSLTFKNSQRIANNTGQFFKTRKATESSKIWLNATNRKGDFSQMAVTYFDGGTVGVDAFDGRYINDSRIALTSAIDSEEYTIQGRPSFDASDVVALNFKTEVADDYTIAIDHSEGVFAAAQDVYLVDNKMGTETNLKSGGYTFAAIAGVDNARFSLKYQKTLKVDASVFNENSVAVFVKNGTLYINSGTVVIDNIQVYDVQGRLITERRNVKSTTAELDTIKVNNQVLLVKISSDTNEVVTKKVVK